MIVKYNEKEMEVDPSQIVPGDIILVRPGERIPLDGEVLEGEASIDTSASFMFEIVLILSETNSYLSLRVSLFFLYNSL